MLDSAPTPLPNGVVSAAHWSILSVMASSAGQTVSAFLEVIEGEAVEVRDLVVLVKTDWTLNSAHAAGENPWSFVSWPDARKWALALCRCVRHVGEPLAPSTWSRVPQCLGPSSPLLRDLVAPI